MLTTHFEAKRKETRKTRLLVALIFSVITTAIGTLFSRAWAQILAVILGIFVSFWFMSKTHEYTVNTFIENKPEKGMQYYFQSIKNYKKALLSFVTYAIFVVFIFGILQGLQFMPLPPLINLALLIVLFLFLDAFSHIFWFVYQEGQGYFNNILETLSILFSKNIQVFKVGVKYLKPLIQGVIITFILVVFFNSVAIQAALELSEAQSTIAIKKIFATDKSQFIISLGTFLTFYYIYTNGSIYYLNQIKEKK